MRVAINGFGRIGRSVFRVCMERKINVVAINDPNDIKTIAYLLKYDSVYGKFKGNISTKGENILIVNNKKIHVSHDRDPLNLPWKRLKIDVVVESTGAFRNGKDAYKHIKAGAKKVIISAPATNHDATILSGININKLNKNQRIISCASCTTNALAPIAKLLNDHYGIEKAFMNTVHGYTSSQNLVDGAQKRLRRGRAAAVNIVLTTSGATTATIEAIPELKNKMDGLAIRVPVVNGSIVDFTALLKKKVSVKQINDMFKKEANTQLKGILGYTEDEIVSTDVIGDSRSSIVDGLSTQVVGGNLVKVLAWYDNEYGYSNRLVDVIEKLAKG